MAKSYSLKCCETGCQAVPLTKEMFCEIDRKNMGLAIDLVLVNSFLVYCGLLGKYLPVRLPEGELIF